MPQMTESSVEFINPTDFGVADANIDPTDAIQI